MSDSTQEIEAKFYVLELERIRARLREMKAHLIQERVLETNIRFDLPDSRLRNEGRVLRLRRDTEVRFTYKGPSKNEQGVLSRTEIEFTVGDFEKAKEFLKALGYQSILYYEKFRTTYDVEKTHIMLDELPYGNFIEIEGEKIELIREVSDQLSLNWDTAIAASYHELFDRVCSNLNLSSRILSFESFAGIQVDPVHLNLRAADA